jgi:hypothetical protein
MNIKFQLMTSGELPLSWRLFLDFLVGLWLQHGYDCIIIYNWLPVIGYWLFATYNRL